MNTENMSAEEAKEYIATVNAVADFMDAALARSVAVGIVHFDDIEAVALVFNTPQEQEIFDSLAALFRVLYPLWDVLMQEAVAFVFENELNTVRGL